MLTWTDYVTLNAGTVIIDNDPALAANLDNIIVTISGDVDFTTLAQLTLDVTDVHFVVPAGSSLTILAEDANGLTVNGDGVVIVEALEATPAADLSKIMTTDGDTGTVEALVTTDAGRRCRLHRQARQGARHRVRRRHFRRDRCDAGYGCLRS